MFWADFLDVMPIHAIIFVLGTLIGSFLNVVIARVPLGQSVVSPRSRCPHCHTMIQAHQNIPIISWLFLRGQCANCKAPISIRYPIVEALCGVLFLACWSRFGPTAAFFFGCYLSAILLAITFIDIDTYSIPEILIWPSIVLGLVLRPIVFEVPWWSGLVGAFMGAISLLSIRWLYFAWRGIEGMGLGDVQLIAMIGSILGVGSLFPTIIIGSIFGAVIGLFILAFQPESEEKQDDDGLEEEEYPEAKNFWLGFVWRSSKVVFSLGVPKHYSARTYVRAALHKGYTWPVRSTITLGIFQDAPGWGHFEGIRLGFGRYKWWFGPMLGMRTADVEDWGQEEEWVPGPTALPFGPFLAFGALATMYFSPILPF